MSDGGYVAVVSVQDMPRLRVEIINFMGRCHSAVESRTVVDDEGHGRTFYRFADPAEHRAFLELFN